LQGGGELCGVVAEALPPKRPAGMVGRVRSADGRKRWIKAVDLRPSTEGG
jgi:hypothetical protein